MPQDFVPFCPQHASVPLGSVVHGEPVEQHCPLHTLTLLGQQVPVTLSPQTSPEGQQNRPQAWLGGQGLHISVPLESVTHGSLLAQQCPLQIGWFVGQQKPSAVAHASKNLMQHCAVFPVPQICVAGQVH